jgi:hypothetical protein
LSRLRRAIAVASLIAGTLALGQLPAVATAASGPAVTISAKSANKVIKGDVLVVYLGGKYATATISGTVTGGAAGDTATLEAQPFGGTAAPAASVPVTSASQAYSFTVKPAVATTYTVQLAVTGTTTPLATSPARVVYAVNSGKSSGAKTCARPVCHETLRIVEYVPPSALKTEMAKRVYAYFGVNLGGSKVPSSPTSVTLNAGHASVSKAKELAAGKFTFNISYSFTIGSHSYYWRWVACAKDRESTDGLGLPGTHSCGDKRLKLTFNYLG